MNRLNRIGDWIQTYTGKKFWPLDPISEEVDIQDIAHALSNMCRYGGHCKQFYSVAEHSVLVSQVVPLDMAMVGLLHDAAEAYVIDVPRPLKKYLTNYKEIEQLVWEAICIKFRLDPELPEEVKHADNAVMFAEKEQIMAYTTTLWADEVPPARVKVVGLSPPEAKQLFLTVFEECGGKL